MKLKFYLQLVRPANLVTALTDIIAGVAISGFFNNTGENSWTWIWLGLSTISLYGGGIVFNDVFDAELDAVERPERAIPSGRVTLREAAILASVLFAAGISFAFFVSPLSGSIAVVITVLALIYNKWGKHDAFFGPVNMGLCRGANLLLGVSIFNQAFYNLWYLGIVPVLYIAAITMVSRGEVHGGSRQTLWFAGFLYLLVDTTQLFVAWKSGYLPVTVIFVLLHLYLVFKPLTEAIRNPAGPNIGKAVKAGVLALIVMDAVWVSVSGNYLLAIGVVLLFPVSIRLAKLFAVT